MLLSTDSGAPSPLFVCLSVCAAGPCSWGRTDRAAVSLSVCTAGRVPGADHDDPHHPVLGILRQPQHGASVALVGVIPLLRPLQLRGPHAGRLRLRQGGHALLGGLLPLQEPQEVPQGKYI